MKCLSAISMLISISDGFVLDGIRMMKKKNHNPFHQETMGQQINSLHFWIPQIISIKN
jgi:hypothetical protein